MTDINSEVKCPALPDRARPSPREGASHPPRVERSPHILHARAS